MLSLRPANELDGNERRQALALLFSQVPASEYEQRIEKGFAALERGELDPACFLTAWLSGAPAGALVCEILPGRAANIWPIRCNARFDREPIENALLARAIGLFQSRRSKFAQSLLPPADRGNADALERNGFHRLTRVWIMGAALPHSPSAPNTMQFESRSAANEAAFVRLLSSTFKESRDCPELNDIRTSEEVYAGYLAGSPDPNCWWLARQEAEPVGVLILGEGSTGGLRELAYLGVVPAARRRGVAREMLSFALQFAQNQGAFGMTLMVDERNRPAINLYERLGFKTIDMRDVYLRLAAAE